MTYISEIPRETDIALRERNFGGRFLAKTMIHQLRRSLCPYTTVDSFCIPLSCREPCIADTQAYITFQSSQAHLTSPTRSGGGCVTFVTRSVQSHQMYEEYRALLFAWPGHKQYNYIGYEPAVEGSEYVKLNSHHLKIPWVMDQNY